MSDPFAGLPEALKQVARRELDDGERVIWAGQPIPGAAATGTWKRLVAGAVFLVIGGLVVWAATNQFINWRHHGDSEYVVGGVALCALALPLVWCGMGLMGTGARMRRRAAASAYVFTDRRAIAFEAGPSGRRSVQSRDWREVRDLSRHERSDGSGDLMLHAEQFGVRVRGVARVWEVEKLARRLVREARGEEQGR